MTHETIDTCKPLLAAYFDRIAKSIKKQPGDSVAARVAVGDTAFRLVQRVDKIKPRIGIGKGGAIDAALHGAMARVWHLKPIIKDKDKDKDGMEDTAETADTKDKENTEIEDEDLFKTVDHLEHLARTGARREAFVAEVVELLSNLPTIEKQQVKLYVAAGRRKRIQKK